MGTDIAEKIARIPVIRKFHGYHPCLDHAEIRITSYNVCYTKLLRATAEVANPLDRLRAAIDRLTGQQKILLMVAVAALIAVIVAGSTWVKQSDYRILFSNIGERDGGSIIAALDQMNIPYTFSESGSSILIPSDKVHEVRLRLASQGLPKGGGVGFELMENQKFGISQFAEQVNYQRGP